MWLAANDNFLVANDATGIAELVERLGGGIAIRVVMEASGDYERLPHHELVDKGLITAIFNPKRVRGFANALGFDAETDPLPTPTSGARRGPRVDANVIDEYGEITDLRAPPFFRPSGKNSPNCSPAGGS